MKNITQKICLWKRLRQKHWGKKVEQDVWFCHTPVNISKTFFSPPKLSRGVQKKWVVYQYPTTWATLRQSPFHLQHMEAPVNWKVSHIPKPLDSLASENLTRGLCSLEFLPFPWIMHQQELPPLTTQLLFLSKAWNGLRSQRKLPTRPLPGMRHFTPCVRYSPGCEGHSFLGCRT